ncbi:MAG: hypothetical protein JWM80_6104 [Cyanobacteria bacterium RYN_339]|nr:hypothetical protein [Cyanobacteria bacterium RYN_339]
MIALELGLVALSFISAGAICAVCITSANANNRIEGLQELQ